MITCTKSYDASLYQCQVNADMLSHVIPLGWAVISLRSTGYSYLEQSINTPWSYFSTPDKHGLKKCSDLSTRTCTTLRYTSTCTSTAGSRPSPTPHLSRVYSSLKLADKHACIWSVSTAWNQRPLKLRRWPYMHAPPPLKKINALRWNNPKFPVVLMKTKRHSNGDFISGVCEMKVRTNFNKKRQ